MPSPVEINPEESPQHRFAYEMRLHRLERGWSQAELSEMLNESNSKISNIETTYRRPDERFARALDRQFGLEGYFLRLHREMRFQAAPPHYRDFRSAQEQADEAHIWTPMLIPGLFQTETYARRVFEDEPGISPEEVEQRVQVRLQRQRILSRATGPKILSLIDEAVLHRPLGDGSMMREQLRHLVDLAAHPRVTIQVVPYESWSAVGCLGAFEVAMTGGRAVAVYVEATPQGHTLENRDMVPQILSRWSRLREAALPRNLSLRKIEEVITKWT